MSIENEIKILTLSADSKSVYCTEIIHWAEMWDWGVGKIVAERLSKNEFKDWETVFVLNVDNQYAGLCIFEKKDAWGTDLNLELTPFITAIYIDSKFRGHHLSEKLLKAASDFACKLGFKALYLISGEQGLYEKFGFEKFAQTITLSGTTEPIYKRSLV